MGVSQAAVGCAMGVLLAGTSAVAAADGAPTTSVHELRIDRQPLDLALQQLARQCGLQIIFFSSVTEGLAAPALAGAHTIESALSALLAGSGLSFRVINDQTVEVRPARMHVPKRQAVPAAALRHPAEPDVMDEVVVVGVAEQLVATRIATPLREIPQSISIVSGEQSRLQNDVELADVLEHAPGITVLRSSSLDQSFYSRGYSISSYHVDGGAAMQSNGVILLPLRGTPDLSEFDHVEILRGADGLFGGNANPGGTVSLVRKRPQHHFAMQMNASTGSWGDRRAELDVTSPLAFDGALRGRAVAVAGQDGYFYDVDAHDRKKLFAVVDYDFTPTATLTAGGSYQWDKGGVLNGGVPLYQSGRDSRLPRDTTLAFDWNSYRGSLAETYLQYRQQLGDDWDLKVNTARWRALADYRMGMFGSAIHVLTDEISPPNGSSTVEPAEFTQTTADVTFTGTLSWFGLRHEVAIGADFTRSEVDTHDALYLDVGPGLESVESFDPTNYPDPREAAPFFLESQGGARLDQYGAFASLRTYLGEAWSLTTGARINFNETTLRATIEIGGVPLVWETGYRVKPIVTPFAGVMYALNDHYSLYASYAEIYEGSGVQQSRPGRKMSATRGINYEAGIKASWRGGALNGSMVAYQVEQRDMPVFDELWINDVDDINCCFFTSSTRSRGVDMDLSGEVVRGWLLGAGYTYNVNEQRTGAPLSTQTPKHLFKAWTNYRLPAQLHRWQVGGSVHAQSRSLERQNLCNGTTGICGPYDAVQRSYAVLGLRAAFDLGDSWEIAVKLDNALDKIYYETIDMGFRAWYGDPRHWSLRLDGRF